MKLFLKNQKKIWKMSCNPSKRKQQKIRHRIREKPEDTEDRSTYLNNLLCKISVKMKLLNGETEII